MSVGIPRKSRKRTIPVTVYINHDEHVRLTKEAFEKGLTVAELFRRKALGTKD